MKRIVVAGDSFKGSLSSLEFGEACREGIQAVIPEAQIDIITLADGGEGTVAAFTRVWHGEEITVTVNDALMRPRRAVYGASPDGSTAVVEMAQAAGLPVLSNNERNPWITTSYGVGQLINDAVRRGCRRIIVGLGGSATTDGGLGMLQALGFRFTDHNGALIAPGAAGRNMSRVYRIDSTGVDPRLHKVEFVIASDVTNPFHGKLGAAWIFGRQKGADDAMIQQLDNGLANLAIVYLRATGIDVQSIQGSGAAGGLGGALAAILNARMESGIGLVLDAARFDDAAREASLVITGEGRMDAQTLMGKAPAGVLARADALGVPVVALCGAVDYSDALLQSRFKGIFSIQPGAITLAEAMQPETAKKNLRDTAAQVTKCFFS